MATSKSLDALRDTREALDEIKKQLKPFLRDLVGESTEDTDESPAASNRQPNEEDKKKTAQAAMAVALAMGTLRYMGARLRGLDKGRSQDDPLRKELNSMRKLMVTLQKKLDETKSKKEVPKRKTDEAGDSTEKSDGKRRKVSKS